MSDRAKNNFIIILLLFVELAICVGLFFISIIMNIYSGPIWLYYLLIITPSVFGAVLSGLTIGYLGSQEDVWKLVIGMMGFASIANTFLLLFLTNEAPAYVMALSILGIFACNTIIFLVTYFVSKNKLKTFDLIVEQQELTDEEYAILDSIAS